MDALNQNVLLENEREKRVAIAVRMAHFAKKKDWHRYLKRK